MNRNGAVLLVLLCFGICGIFHAQTTSISGIVNTYTKVVGVARCPYMVDVISSAGFTVGDKALIIQMTGADIDTTNTSSFGSVLSLNNAGRFELVRIIAIAGNSITFQNRLLHTYDGQQCVQLIRVPEYQNALVVDTLKAMPWNGDVGGVLVLDIAGILTLNADLKVSGMGFRGGAKSTNGSNPTCFEWAFPLTSLKGGAKGEGIALVDAAHKAGRGPLASGGGGGNAVNTGGGGGGNGGAGGIGGRQYNGSPPGDVMGLGGISLTGYSGTNRAFLGGGGGGGHQNNLSATSGAAGGGMVILRAGTIVSQGHVIWADGWSAATAGNDGAGGGGSGGTICLDVPNITSLLTVSVKGGPGGNNAYGNNQCHGPGGGGGGGVALVSSTTPLGQLVPSLSGGVSGMMTNSGSPCYGTSYGATAGNAGGVLTDFVLPTGTVPVLPMSVSGGGNHTICIDSCVQLHVNVIGGSPPVSVHWTPADGLSNPNDSVTMACPKYSCVYTAVISDMAGCIDSTVKETFTVSWNPVKIAGPTVLCLGDSAVLTASTGFLQYRWSTNATTRTITVLSPGVYSVRATDSNGCSAKDSVYLPQSPPISLNLGPDLELCRGSSARIGSTVSGGVPPFRYEWTPVQGLDNDTIAMPTASPSLTTTYAVKVTDANGCSFTDFLTIHVLPTPSAALKREHLICLGSDVQIGALAENGTPPYRYSWTPAARLNDTTIARPVAAPTHPTMYVLTITDSKGCRHVDTVRVIVGIPLLVELDSVQRVCHGTPSRFMPRVLGGTPPFSYEWSPPGGLSAIREEQPLVDPPIQTRYTLVIRDAAGCTGRDSILVTVGSPPRVDAGPDTLVCPMDTAFIGQSVAGGTPPYSVWWTPAGRILRPDSLRTAVVSPLSGVYILRVTDANGCASFDSVRVNVRSVAQVSITPSGSTRFCLGDSVTLNAGSGFQSYRWSTGETTRSIVTRQTGLYWVVAANANSCKVTSDTIFVEARQAFVPDVRALTTLTICPGDSAVLEAELGFRSYLWSNGQTTRRIIVKIASDYTVAVTDSNGCTGISVPVHVTSSTPPSPVIIGPAGVCANTMAMYQAGARAGRRHSWTVTGGILLSDSASGQVTVRWGQTGTGRIELREILDSSGCSGSADLLITVGSQLQPRIIGTAILCEGDSIQLATEPGYASYRWLRDTTEISHGNPVFVGRGGLYVVMVTDSGGCAGSASWTVTSKPKPAPLISGPGTICEGDTAVLESVGSYPSYEWRVDSAIISSDRRIPTVKPGLYTLSVSDSAGCSGSVSTILHVQQVVRPIIGGSHLLCEGDSIVLDAGTGYLAYEWNTGVSGQSIVVNTVGTYSVRVTDSLGCHAVATAAITSHPKPVPVIAGPESVCEGDTIVLDAGNGFPCYRWSNGGTGQFISVSDAGTIRVEVTDSAGCTGTAMHTVAREPRPDAKIAGPRSVCIGRTALYHAPVQTGRSYDWTVSGGTVRSGSGTDAITIEWGAAGQGRVIVTVSIAGCTGADTLDVTVGKNLLPVITTTATAFCEGDSSALDAGGGYASYEWRCDSVVIAASQRVIARLAGEYTVTVVDSAGCSGSASVTMVVHPRPAPVIVGPTAFCEGDSVVLGVSDQYDVYDWRDENNRTVSAAKLVAVARAGIYTVTVTDSKGCTNTSLPHIVRMYSKPAPPSITQSGDTLMAIQPSAVSYQWYFGSTLVPGATDQRLLATQEGFYSVRITDANGCSAQSPPFDFKRGMLATATVQLPVIEAAPGERVTIPIILSAAQNLEQSGAKDFTATIRFNKSLLFPMGSTPLGTTDDSSRVITIPNSSFVIRHSLAELDFLATLGNADRTPLHFDSFDFNGAPVNVTTIDGEFHLRICREGGDRLFDATGRFGLAQNHPNPFNALTSIDYELIETSPVRLAVLDILGREVAVLVDGRIEPGRYRVSFDASSLASGLYVALISTPSQSAYRVMRVLK